MSTVPAEFAGEVAVIWVLLSMIKLAELKPKLTLVAVEKFVPVRMTLVPPEVRPRFGEIPLTVGGAIKVN